MAETFEKRLADNLTDRVGPFGDFDQPDALTEEDIAGALEACALKLVPTVWMVDEAIEEEPEGDELETLPDGFLP
jgi:hypothetical protein